MIFGRQPAFWIGLIGTILVGAITTVAGTGVISEVTSGKAIDLVNSTVQLGVLLAPLIAGLVIRTQVTPVAAPSLPEGTKVEVVTPPGEPNLTKVL